jgi:hypothetical protein
LMRRSLSIPHRPYIYQLILVCQIRDNPAIVSIQFLKGAEDRVFCMAFTRFLASSVTAKIAARMPSYCHVGEIAQAQRLILGKRPRRSEVQRVRRSAPHLVAPAQVERISARLKQRGTVKRVKRRAN